MSDFKQFVDEVYSGCRHHEWSVFVELEVEQSQVEDVLGKTVHLVVVLVPDDL